MAVFNNEQVGTMVDEICGEEAHPNFEDVKYGQDPLHPRDNECISAKDDNSSDNEEIKKLYTDPNPTDRSKVRDVERI